MGYDCEYQTKIVVKIDDLQIGSGAMVEVLCDYCKENIIRLSYKDYNKRMSKYGDCSCYKCKPIKTKISNMNKYGVESTFSLEEVRDKVKKTNLERYGAPCSLQNEEVRNKAIETCRKHYGVDYSIQSKEVHDKTVESLYRHYGVTQPTKSLEIRNKIAETLYKNNTQKSSKQQVYLNDLYNGELNYPISNFSADICLLTDKIIIEYDGGGHLLHVKTGRITQEEFKRRTFVRDQIVKKAGYKQIRIISYNDYLPSDEILLQMLEQAKEYFNTTNHTWVEYNIDSSIMRNAEHKEGVYFDFGELRKLKRVS